MVQVRTVSIRDGLVVGNDSRFTFIGGPCVIESERLLMETAEKVKRITEKLNINFIFKSSFDKANRSSIESFRGLGFEEGLRILEKIKKTYDIPIITDVHESWQCASVAEVVDVLQIPAFLCRQTDLLIAAAKTGRTVNIKKGQFLSPGEMKNVIYKLEEIGHRQILLTERGTSFGYNNLVVDMRSLVEMRKLGYPIVFDATHSVQRPGGLGTATGGDREFVPYLMNAAMAVGIDAIFAETHPNPEKALSDGPNMIPLHELEDILSQALEIKSVIKKKIIE
ncbi:3-deoxy-8-phosphooctulonate synthase [Cohnella lubricantis]|uniref:2-dehydro-3-deoxyphosphooctonate aldolase n=1 Tax=Cohnella lubricantis TaxID=2163172 RepID=A0A841TFZ9_9BACL|nr:3-deoxy-8-phosphooctulonate synthase [Cohnella lubricantis]MBB6677391.1 3-deoxy-8-phosphooctulonate synthase [Cohnella lubricantis]MBP2118718.1 2-dehydro-3-deoxyphosphooctonate aldolase (KDO 8-P synthase) [Cohnella lubricantis]